MSISKQSSARSSKIDFWKVAPPDVSILEREDATLRRPKELVFLESEAWKLLVPGSENNVHLTRWLVEIKAQIKTPPNFLASDMPFAKAALQYCMGKKKHEIFSLVGAEERDARMELDMFPDESPARIQPSGRKSAWLQVLQEQSNNRPVQDWLRLYCRGVAFASEIRRLDDERFLLIEELFGSPENYEKIRNEVEARRNHPTILVGDPKTGKTYTALRILYDVFVKHGGRIRYYSTVAAFGRDLENLLESDGREGTNPEMYVYVDDPFGRLEFDEESTRVFLENFKRVLTSDKPFHIIITSRDKIFQLAKQRCAHIAPWLLQVEAVRFRMGSAKDSKSSTYAVETLRGIFGRLAWLKNAQWFSEYRSAVDQSRASKAQSTETAEAWRELVESDCPPGSFLTGFNIFGDVLKYQGRDLVEIQRIRKILQNPEDLVAAFNSELVASLSSDRARAALHTFVLLPAMTLFEVGAEGQIFSTEELDQIVPYRELLTQEKAEDVAYGVTSYQYFSDSLAEAAKKYVIQHGKQEFEQYLLRVMADEKRHFSKATLRDLLSTYFALGGTTANRPAMEAANRLDGVNRHWLAVIRYVFMVVADEEHKANEFAKTVREAIREISKEPTLLSNLSSLLDELLVASQRNDQRYAVAVSELMNDFIAQSHDTTDAPQGNSALFLNESFLLHGLLSHLELYWSPINFEAVESTRPKNESRDLSGGGNPASPTGNNQPFGLAEIIASNSVLDVIERGKTGWLESGIIWIDALLMKIGELTYYLSRDSVLRESTLRDVGIVEPADTHVQDVESVLRELHKNLRTIWTATTNQAKVAKREMFLRGSIAFTIVWHNRFGTQGKCEACAEFTDWITEIARSFVEIPTPEVSADYWTGVGFNVQYHGAFFEGKAQAWERESAIYLWRRSNPRLGADALYESGLEAGDVGIDWLREMQMRFYSTCPQELLNPRAHIQSVADLDTLSSVAFVLGMRAPRDDLLLSKYEDAIFAPLKRPESRAFCAAIWKGVAKLFIHGFRDSERAIQMMLNRQKPSISRDLLDTLKTDLLAHERAGANAKAGIERFFADLEKHVGRESPTSI